MKNKNRKTSAKSLYESQESKVSPIEENDDAWEEIETIDSGRRFDSLLHKSVRWDFKPWSRLHMT